MSCPECKGKGEIKLFTSTQPCEACMGTGMTESELGGDYKAREEASEAVTAQKVADAMKKASSGGMGFPQPMTSWYPKGFANTSSGNTGSSVDTSTTSTDSLSTSLFSVYMRCGARSIPSAANGDAGFAPTIDVWTDDDVNQSNNSTAMVLTSEMVSINSMSTDGEAEIVAFASDHNPWMDAVGGTLYFQTKKGEWLCGTLASFTWVCGPPSEPMRIECRLVNVHDAGEPRDDV